MKKIAITGGTGFIGTALTKKLISQNYDVKILTRKEPAKKIDKIQYSVISFDDINSLAEAIKGVDTVIHAAAKLFSRTKKGFERGNIISTRNLVSACNSLDRKPEKFIYISSLAAGGPSPDKNLPKTEDMPENPVSYYGKTKLEGEKEVKKLFPEIKTVILRPPIVYGKRDAGISTIAYWVKKGFMVNAGSKNGYFTFIYLEDLVQAIITAIENIAVAGKVYYVCENSMYKWETFIKLIAQSMKVRMPIMVDLPPKVMYTLGLIYELFSLSDSPMFNRDKAREGSAKHWIASPARWEKDTNWPGWTPLEEGIKKTFE